MARDSASLEQSRTDLSRKAWKRMQKATAIATTPNATAWFCVSLEGLALLLSCVMKRLPGPRRCIWRKAAPRTISLQHLSTGVKVCVSSWRDMRAKQWYGITLHYSKRDSPFQLLPLCINGWARQRGCFLLEFPFRVPVRSISTEGLLHYWSLWFIFGSSTSATSGLEFMSWCHIEFNLFIYLLLLIFQRIKM